MNYKIYPPEELIETSVVMPPSKSVLNRRLLINAIAGEPEYTPDDADCDDIMVMRRALVPDAPDSVDVGASGTALRFLTAYFAVCQGRTVTVDGTEGLRKRPVAPLVDALRGLGADIEYLGEDGYAPMRISGRKLEGGDVTVDATRSSQYLSALLLVAPAMEQGLAMTLDGEPASEPYLRMTLSLMAEAGIKADWTGARICVPAGRYDVLRGPVEGDWSAASYWYEIAAISSGFVTLNGLNPESAQGDKAVTRYFEVYGLQTDFEGENGGIDLLPTPDPGARLIADMSATPDLVPALAVTCCLLSIPFRFTGVQSLRVKECDRIEALKTELTKLGYPVSDAEPGELQWSGTRYPIYEAPAIDTYADHRMAMAFAPVALFLDGLQINDVEVVGKSYPAFWDDLRRAGFRLEEAV